MVVVRIKCNWNPVITRPLLDGVNDLLVDNPLAVILNDNAGNAIENSFQAFAKLSAMLVIDVVGLFRVNSDDLLTLRDHACLYRGSPRGPRNDTCAVNVVFRQ